MPLELFLDLYSPPCRAIYIFAKKNGIPFEFRPVELGRGGSWLGWATWGVASRSQILLSHPSSASPRGAPEA